MRLAITDANIFIDLIHIGFVDHLFKIGFEIHTCAEVVEALNERQQAILVAFREQALLTVHHLSEDDESTSNFQQNYLISESIPHYAFLNFHSRKFISTWTLSVSV